MAQNAIEKITQRYALRLAPGTELHATDYVFIAPKHVMTHDNTGAVIPKFRTIGARRVARPEQPVYALDHNVQDTSEKNLNKYEGIASFARENGVTHFPAGAGIGHQLMLEEGFVTPGSFVVASDSHSNIYGALAAVGTPVVRTDAAAIWASGETWWQIPDVVKVTLTGELREGVTGKDVIITLCGTFNNNEVLNCALEFGGPGVASLSVEDRMTIANMTTEWGALVGFFPCDERTIEYLQARAGALAARGDKKPRLSIDAIRSMDTSWFQPDPDARYALEITLDLSTVSPQVTGAGGVREIFPVSEMEEQNIKINKAYLLSCVNGRLEDIRQAARVVKGKKVAAGVEFYVAAASASIQAEAEADGSWQTLMEAGAIALPPGCGPCIGLGAGTLGPNEVGVSATNRNFKGRMGDKSSRAHLASPAVVAASAIAGRICRSDAGAEKLELRSSLTRPTAAAFAGESRIDVVKGFPHEFRGRLLFLDKDALNTDGIYAGKWTYRDDMEPAEMATKAFENYDPNFATVARAGDIILGGLSFGSGSSREQAATCLKYFGIQLVLAGSFSQTYKRNAINNGFVCVECPALLEDIRNTSPNPVAPTLVAGDEIVVDIVASQVRFGGKSYPIPPVSTVPQELVANGGLERWLRAKLGSDA